MRVNNWAKLTASEIEVVEKELSECRTLHEVMQWGLSQPAGTVIPHIVEDVVVQDEFSHDVVVPWRAGLFLVYSTT